MHKYQFESSRRKSKTSKTLLASSRREVILEAPKRKRKASPALSSQEILTSRPTSEDKSITPAQFYERPKSLLEKQYERNLRKYVPLSEGKEEFVALELETESSPAIEEARPLEAKLEPEPEPEPIEVADLTNEEIEALLVKGGDVEIGLLINVSDYFLSKAHSSVLDANSLPGSKAYYSYVKVALKALHMLLSEHATRLNPSLELAVHYKLAKLYFFETLNATVAELYISKAISLSARHNLLSIRASCEFLYCQILESSKAGLVEPFFLERKTFYNKCKWDNIANMFSLLRANLLMTTSLQNGVAALQLLSTSTTALFAHILSLVLLANVGMYRGSPETSSEYLSRARKAIEQVLAPPQLKVMVMLGQLACFVQLNHADKAKGLIEELSKIVNSQREAKWESWREDGYFTLSIPVAEGQDTSLSFDVQWLSSDEFVIMYYFLSGVLLLQESANYKRAHKILSTCLEIINIQLEELTQAKQSTRSFSVSLLTGKIVRLNYTRFCVYYYKLWLDFMHKDDFTGIALIEGFVKSFDESNFTKEELCYYKLLIPRFYYLAGLYYHSHGDLVAAKYYYQRVRDTCLSASLPDNLAVSNSQRSLGIGCEHLLSRGDSNELYIFATLHLLILNEYEMWRFALLPDETGQQMAHSREQLTSLYSDLTIAFDKSPAQPRKSELTSTLLKSTFQLISCIFSNKGFVEDAKLVQPSSSDFSECGESSGYIGAVCQFVLYRLAVNLEKSQEHYKAAFAKSSGKTDANSLIRYLLQLEKKEASGEAAPQTEMHKLHGRILAKLELAQQSTE